MPEGPEIRREADRIGRVLTGCGRLAHDTRSLKAEGFARREYRHRVFGRVGKRCRACGETLEKLAHSGRRIYLCHACQGRVAS